ncbi:ATP:ADP antiporter, AAA family [Enhydrobacter aerosaccus]|uniref:ATP:ADP antiporter, AAA family n=1 Tax=Enhydrobacter aerosaccus TaxID=225324 RepID=A0A1T4SRZ2_9HYPH|nr:MFS transporter [Enhydrobacter aerosaccus]SKA30999.1 ATP:ADP antiporter, AAA family [Enhydrobacter aerosaccus]
MSLRQTALRRWMGIEPGEAPAVLAGFLMLFTLFTCYFSLRPVRETMGIAGGVNNLQWLFTATFLATLAVSPAFGWLVSRIRRRHIVRWVLGISGATLVTFAACVRAYGEAAWLARFFFVWLSVFNLVAISLAWSVLVDVFTDAQARRVFSLMAAGASLGGLAGPLIGVFLATRIGNAGLLALAAAMLVPATVCADHLSGRVGTSGTARQADGSERDTMIGGSPLAGAIHVLRSPFLLSIALFVILLASVSTFLYFEQARFVAGRFADRAEQTRFFSGMDAVVQCATLLIQLFLTGRIAAAFGLRFLLLALPLVTVLGFVLLSVSSLFGLFVVVMVVRRVGEYALVRPGREMLFTRVPVDDKYKAKNFIDTVVYRGADAVSGWVKTGSDLLLGSQMGAVAGAVVALAWAGSAIATLRFHRRIERRIEAAEASAAGEPVPPPVVAGSAGR